MTADITFVEPQARLYEAWRRLYGDYGESVGDPLDDAVAHTVWAWLLHAEHRVGGLLALCREEVVGFAHYRPFPRTLHGNEACYLDDLFVAPEYRGRGIAAELVRHVCEIAQRMGWTEVRWVTGSDNAVAQRLYERIAERSPLITYRLRLSSPTPP